jgi:hypothetical protein
MLPSAIVHALGVGEIEVESALNEPLKAEIKLLSATKDELDTLEVALASNAAFARMGIDKLPVLSSLEFELIREGAGSPFVKAYSKKPIREPFLDFILTVNWANGQLLREYTLLLDPPVFQEAEKPAPVAAPVTQPAEIVRSQPTARPALEKVTLTILKRVTFCGHRKWRPLLHCLNLRQQLKQTDNTRIGWYRKAERLRLVVSSVLLRPPSLIVQQHHHLRLQQRLQANSLQDCNC